MWKEGGFKIGPLRIGASRSEDGFRPPRSLISPFKDISDITLLLDESPKGPVMKNLGRVFEEEADKFAHIAIKYGWFDQPELAPIESLIFMIRVFGEYLDAQVPVISPSRKVQYFETKKALSRYEKQQVRRVLKLVPEPDGWRKSLGYLARSVFSQYKFDQEKHRYQAPDNLRPISELFDFGILLKNRPKIIGQMVNTRV